MGLLKKNGFVSTRDFNNGLHIVKLIKFGETPATSRTLDNGELKENKATLWFKLEDITGAQDKHTFYYETEPVLNEETGKPEPSITAADEERLSRIISAIRKQVPCKELEEQEDLVSVLTYLQSNACQFKVVVSETPSQDGKIMWKNFSYNADMIQLLDNKNKSLLKK